MIRVTDIQILVQPAPPTFPTFLRGSSTNAVVMFVGPNKGIVIEHGTAFTKDQVGLLVDNLIHFSSPKWEKVRKGYAVTLCA